MSFHYRLYGLRLASDLELPELHPAPPAPPAEIRIVLVPFAPDGAPFQAAPGVYRFTIKGVAHY